MTTDLEYALFAANVYGSKDRNVTGATAQVRHPRNTLSMPDGWMALGDPVVKTDGFMAQAYVRGNEIVISYAGTTFEDALDWVTGNVPAATAAILAPQVTDAAKYYLDVLASHPGASITFTGHSLGGGLASLMAVYFDKPAVVFDEAPFLKSADSLKIVDALRQTLERSGYTLPSALQSYVAYDQTGAFIPSPTRTARDDQVRQIYVKGEALSIASTALTNFFAVVLGRVNAQVGIAGFGVDKINNGTTLALDPRAQSLLGWGVSVSGTSVTDGDPVALHSISLLAAFLQTPSFLSLVQDYPELLPRVMAGMFKNEPQHREANLLDLLVQREYRGEGVMAALIADVRLIDRSNGLTSLRDVPGAGNVHGDADYVAAIAIDAALAGLYDQGKARRPEQGNSGSFERVFDQVQGGFRFDIAEFSGSVRVLNERLDHLKNLLLGTDVSAGHYTRNARWTLQSGASALNLTQADDGKNDVMIGFDLNDSLGGGDGDDQLLGLAGNDTLKGGTGIDDLVGGDGNDLLEGETGTDYLYGGAGSDTLIGGSNADWLHGGAGTDTYRFSAAFGGDTITDSDGAGVIEVDGVQLTGQDAERAAAGIDVWSDDDWVYTLVANTSGGTDLILQRDSSLNQIRVRNWTNGQLGITLGNSVTPPQFANIFTGDTVKAVHANGVNYQFDAFGNYQSAGSQPDAQDQIHGSNSADSISGGGGNDGLFGRAGNDVIDGGAGADVLLGGAGADTLRGGDGNDYIFGSDAGSGFTQPTRTDFVPREALGTEIARGFNWVVYDPPGTNSLGDNVYTIAGVDFIVPNGESDSNLIEAGAGNDRVRAGSSADIVYAGTGDDNIAGMGGSDALYGEEGNDLVLGDGSQPVDGVYYGEYTPLNRHGNDVIAGGAGNDTLVGQGGDDQVYGGDDDDRLWGDDAVPHDVPVTRRVDHPRHQRLLLATQA